MKLSVLMCAAIMCVSGVAMASDTTTTHMTGHLATKDTMGAWARVRVDIPDGTTIVNVSAAANGKNTYLECVWIDPYGQPVRVDKHTLLCDANVHRLPLPSHLTVDIANENMGPVDYDIAIQNTK